jgi:hypothetical protein
MSVADRSLWGGHLDSVSCLSATEMGRAFGKGLPAVLAWS